MLPCCCFSTPHQPDSLHSYSLKSTALWPAPMLGQGQRLHPRPSRVGASPGESRHHSTQQQIFLPVFEWPLSKAFSYSRQTHRDTICQPHRSDDEIPVFFCCILHFAQPGKTHALSQTGCNAFDILSILSQSPPISSTQVDWQPILPKHHQLYDCSQK